MAAYIIAQVDVSNPDEYVNYARQTPDIAAKFGGKFLAKGGAAEQLEGTGRGRNVIIEFPDGDAARRFYNSDDYQAVIGIRHANSESDLVIVEGV